MANEFKVKKGLIVDGSGGTILDVQGSVGQLFSVTDSLTGDLFAVSDISGIPILNVNSSGAVDIDGTLSITDGVTLSSFGAGYLKTNVDGVISNTATIPWASVSTTPTTISGYGITDALVIGTTSTTAMAGNTVIPTLASLGALSTTGKAADSELLDGLDSARFVYGDNSTKTAVVTSVNTALPSGFYNGNNITGSPTATWYTYLNMRHTNTANNYGSQIAVSFYNNSDMYVRTINNGTYAGWSKVYNEANLTPLTIGTTATTAMAGNTAIPSGNQIIDWTVDNEDIVIHSGNYTDTVYTHPTSAGNKHIPTGGAAGQFLKYSASGTAVWATPSYTTNTNTTYSAGTGLDLNGTTFSIESDLRDVAYVGNDGNNYIYFDSANSRMDFYVGGVFVARVESDGDLHIKGDVIAYSDIFS